MTPARQRRLERELALKCGDPLLRALHRLTPTQLSYVQSACLIKQLIGGNQSGKSWTALIDLLLNARGLHPVHKYTFASPTEEWEGWWATQSYAMIGLQGFKHFKTLMLYPGEDIFRTPTRYVRFVRWHDTRLQIPALVKIKRDDGRLANLYFKSYEQGVEEFASAQVNQLNLDEECSMAIYEQAFVRLAKRDGVMGISATPENSMPYIQRIQDRAEQKERGYFHARISQFDNPSISENFKSRAEIEMTPGSELYNLRILGIAPSRKGLVYSDELFTSRHVCEPFTVPPDWCKYRALDHGFNHTVCLWFAVSPSDDDVVLYREYHGQQKTIQQNVDAILALNAGEQIADTVIDRSTLGAAGTGVNEDGKSIRQLDAYRKAGLDCHESPQHQRWSGIAEVWELLQKKSGAGGTLPKFRVFKTCQYFLEERRKYHGRHVTEELDDQRNDVPDEVVKRDDHAMDAWRYAVRNGLTWRAPRGARPPEPNTLAHAFWQRRQPKKTKLRL